MTRHDRILNGDGGRDVNVVLATPKHSAMASGSHLGNNCWGQGHAYCDPMPWPTEAGPSSEDPTAAFAAGHVDSARTGHVEAAPTGHVEPAPTETLAPALAAGDRCANCGSALASDQRYCLECGERRGQARFTAAPPTKRPPVVREETARRMAPRFSSASTLIAGVGTLLLAMGIGVLIGRSGPSRNAGNSTVRVVNLGGGATASTASTASTPTTAASTGAHKSNGKGKHKAASNATANVTQTVKNIPPPTVTVGAAGQGKGYSNGKFTGTFFGPGG
jgi:hypothetical protein